MGEAKDLTPKVELDTDELLNGALNQIGGILDNIKERSTQEERGKLNINIKLTSYQFSDLDYISEQPPLKEVWASWVVDTNVSKFTKL